MAKHDGTARPACPAPLVAGLTDRGLDTNSEGEMLGVCLP